jgi:hypothetical protein
MCVSTKIIVDTISILSLNWGIVYNYESLQDFTDTLKWEGGRSLLKLLCSFTPEAWLCVGDFNEIVVDSKKFGIVCKPLWQMVDF